MEMSIERPLVDLYILSRDPAFVSLKPGFKQPVGNAWQENPISPEFVHHEFKTSGHNVGLINGDISGIVDVDLDCGEAKQLASLLLPKGLATFEHSGNDRGHILYRVGNSGKTQQYQCPESGETLVELRSTGSQTMIPPSIHPSGQKLKFTFLDDTATRIDFTDLQAQVRKIAALSLIARHWKKGVRHNLALGVSGLLLKSDHNEAQAKEIIAAICEVTGDDELQDRLKAVESTFDQHLENVAGFTQIEALLGSKVTKRVIEWLGSSGTLIRSNSRSEPVILGDLAADEDLTEARVAVAFHSWAMQKAAYVSEKKCWYLWNGVVWQPDISGAITVLFDQFLDGARSDPRSGDFESALKKYEGRSKIMNTLSLAAPRLARSVEEFDGEQMVFAAKDIWINLDTGKPIEPSPAKHISLQSKVAYDASASCPHFLQFVDQIFCGDQDLIQFIQRAVGYSLTGSTAEQCFFILNGDGANGKSTFVNILAKLMGGYSKAAPEQTLLANQRSGVGDDLVYLSGSRFISVSELDQGQALAEAKIKRITGGDEVTGRALFGTYHRQKMIGKIYLATNSLPEVRGRDHGIFRRFQIIPFNRTFAPDEQDGSLPAKLEAELSGILNWAVEGCLKWQSDGLAPPSIVREQREHYRRELDTVQKFFDAELVWKIDGKIGSSELYQNYRDWCRRMGHTAVDDRQFKASMQRIDGVSWKRSNEGRFFVGLEYRDLISNSDDGGEDILF
jgi:putative DNA primase/helicase